MFLQNFAQTAGECTVNGQPVDCGEAAQAAGGIIAGFGIFMLVFFAFGIFSTVIWILSLIHLVQNEDVDNRILWIILVTIIPIANFVYYFGFKRSYDKQKAAGPQNQPASPNVPAATPGVVAPKDSGDSSSFATGAVAGGAAASSGFSDQNSTSPPDLSVADSSDQQPGNMDIGLQDDNTTPDSSEVAQADSAPAYPSEDSSSDAAPETTESVTPETDSYQSGSTEEAALPPDDSSAQPSDNGAGADDDNNNVQPDNNDAGPSIG